MPIDSGADIDESIDDLLPDSQVGKRYKVDPRTLYRWDLNPELKFPKPIRILGRKYRRRRELMAWERQRAAATSGLRPNLRPHN
jgi:hypothetical protein